MHIVVTIKQVPDTSEVRIGPKTNTMIRGGVPSIVNPDDRHAIETAVALKDEFGGGGADPWVGGLEPRLRAVIRGGREINEPRYASLPAMLRAARYEPIVWDKNTL